MNIHIPADFTLAELRAFIEGEVREAPEGYYTAREWAAHFGVHPKRMRALLRQAKERGLLAMARVMREALDGKDMPIPVYALAKPKVEETISDSQEAIQEE